MEGLAYLGVFLIAVWLYAKGSETPKSSSFGARSVGNSSQLRSDSGTGSVRSVESGYWPTDKCTCGGAWVKRRNSETGGRFFACSRYPRCSKTRDEVLRERLGSAYSFYYCARGHEKAHFGVVRDSRSGRDVCKRCIAKGYVKDPRF